MPVVRKCRSLLRSRRPASTKMQIASDDWRRIRRHTHFFAAPPSVHALDLMARTSLAFPRMLPPGRDYDEIYRAVPLADSGAIQHRRRGLRPLGRARSGQARASSRSAQTARRTTSATAGCARLRTGSPTRSRRTASRAATASRSCCRRRPRSRRSTSRSTSSAPSRCRSPCCSAPMRSAYRLQNAGAKALITNAQGLAKLAEIAQATLPGLQLMLSVDGPGDGALGFHADARSAPPPISRRVATAADDPGDDDLHLRHHRPAQGRAACPSRAARPHAGHRDAARFLPAAGRPVLDAGRLGLGRRPARLPAAEPLLRRAGGGAPVRQVRSRGGLRGDGAASACATRSSRRPRCA